MKAWLNSHPTFKSEFMDKLQLYADANVFDSESKEDIEAYIDEIK